MDHGPWTMAQALVKPCNKDDQYVAAHLSLAAARGEIDLKTAMAAILESWDREVSSALTPMPADFRFASYTDYGSPITQAIHRWACRSPKPIVLLLDDLHVLGTDILDKFLNQIQLQ